MKSKCVNQCAWLVPWLKSPKMYLNSNLEIARAYAVYC